MIKYIIETYETKHDASGNRYFCSRVICASNNEETPFFYTYSESEIYHTLVKDGVNPNEIRNLVPNKTNKSSRRSLPRFEIKPDVEMLEIIKETEEKDV